MGSAPEADLATVRDRVRGFIVDNFLFGEDRPFGEEESFLESGLIDSTGILELIRFLEETFSLAVEDEEMVPENLDSLSNIARYVERKREA